LKIKLLSVDHRPEVEFAATIPPLDIQRRSVDLDFENFEEMKAHLWPARG